MVSKQSLSPLSCFQAATTTTASLPGYLFNNNHPSPPSRRSFHASSSSSQSNTYHGTTILCVRKNGKVCMMGDGMVSMGNMTIKPNAVKIQRLFPKGISAATEENAQKATLVGFAGATADAFTLLERLEGKLDEYPGQLSRSCVELAKGWRTDKYLRRLEASLIVADESKSLEITGNGDVLEMTDGVISIGSGSPFALAAARALMSVDDMTAEEVAQRAMDIASDMCVYTNKNFISYTLEDVGDILAGVKEDNK
jgi:ATP-dependent HslUV protease, peptidase subunit HslV